jgi:protein regulator of cytokinesis 1
MDTSYLEKQVSTIINKLHELFDEIGVPSHERDSRESEVRYILIIVVATRTANSTFIALRSTLRNSPQPAPSCNKRET